MVRTRRHLVVLFALGLAGSMLTLAGPAAGSSAPSARAVTCVNPGDVQAAIDAADPGDTIDIGPGTCTENLFINKDIDIVGSGIAVTTLDGAAVDTVVTVVGPAAVTISDVDITNGLGGAFIGGGVDMSGGMVTLTDVRVIGNHGGTGGGIANYGGVLTLNRAVINVNTAGGDGGGIFTNGGLAVHITDSAIIANFAGDGVTGLVDGTAGRNGGGLYNGGSVVVITDSLVDTNFAGDGGIGLDGGPGDDGGAGGSGGHGGGIFNAAGASTTLIRTDVSNNRAGNGGAGGSGGLAPLVGSPGDGGAGGHGGTGGGIFNSLGTAALPGGSLVAGDSSIWSNAAGDGGAGGAGGAGAIPAGSQGLGGFGGPGGGIANLADQSRPGVTPFGAVSLDRASVYWNGAGQPGAGSGVNVYGWGGGIFNGYPGLLTLTNATVSSNTSSSGGGGIDNEGAVVITQSTIAFNEGHEAGGLATYGTASSVDIEQSIMIRNRAGATPIDCGGGGPVSSSGYNLFNHDVNSFGCAIPLEATDLSVGNGYDLAPLADNGGPHTHALSLGQVPVDAIPAGVCALGIDARGVTRPQGTDCDIGAFELAQSGTVNIVKDAVPDSSLDVFDFVSDVDGAEFFNLVDHGGGGFDHIITLINLAPGSYTFTETAEPGWALSGLECVDPDGGSSVVGATATVDLDAGEEVTCTYTNRQLPTANPDFYTTPFETLLEATSVLDNDLDPAGEFMFAIKDSDPAVGHLDWFTSGMFRYTPPAGFAGDVSFQYHVDVDGVASAPALVTITVGDGPTETGTVGGTVRLDGMPLAGVEVWLAEGFGTGGQINHYTCTAGDGTFSFPGIALGVPLVSATGPSIAAGCGNADFIDPGTGAHLQTQFYDHRHVLSTAEVFTLDGPSKMLGYDILYEGDNLGMVDTSQGLWHLRAPFGGWVKSFYFGNPGDAPFVGDWDCDGVATPGLFRQSDAFAYLRNSNSQGVADIRFFFGDPADIPLAGDFNGDGCDTLSLYRPSEQRFYIINELGQNEGGLGAADYTFDFGNPGDTPFVGDFDGDGIDEVGLHRESTGLVYFENALVPNGGGGAADVQFIFGDPEDRFVAGGWVASGFDSPALFRPSDETWYLKFSNTQGNADATIQFGESPWLPVAGFWGLPKTAP